MIVAIAFWTLAALCQSQSLQKAATSLESAFQEIDATALNRPSDLPILLRSKLTTTLPVAVASALVGRSFKDVGEHMTVPLARAIIFESVYADQAAVLEIVRQALLNAPSRLHAQIVAAAIVSVTDPEELVIIELAEAAPGLQKDEVAPGLQKDVDKKAVGSVSETFRVNLEASDPDANLPAQQGPLGYRRAAPGEPGGLALGDAILAAAASVDRNLDLTQFPIAIDSYFLPRFTPPGLAATGPYDLREPFGSNPFSANPANSGIMDPRLPLISPTPPPVPSPSPVSP
jgi:hypothetical protein